MAQFYLKVAWIFFFGLVFEASTTVRANWNLEHKNVPEKVKIGVLRDVRMTHRSATVHEAINFINAKTDLMPLSQLVPVEVFVDFEDVFDIITKVSVLTENGVSGIISQSPCHVLPLLELHTATSKIPHISVYSGLCNLAPTTNYTFTLSTPAKYRLESLIAVITHEGWKGVQVLYDNEAEAPFVSELVQILSEDSIKITSNFIQETSDQEIPLLETLNSMKNIILLCSKNMTEFVLRSASDLQMMTTKHFWIVAGYNISDKALKNLNLSESNILLMKPHVAQRECPDGLSGLQNASWEHTLDDTQISDAVLVFGTVFHTVIKNGQWTVFGTNTTVDFTNQRVIDRLQQMNLTGLGGNIHFKDGYNEKSMIDLCATSYDYTQERVGNWSSQKGLQVNQNGLFPNVLRGFGNRTLKVVSRQAVPFVVKTVTDNITKFTGFCFDILDELAIRHHFRYQVSEPPDMLYGSENDDGTWNGMVGMVMRKEAELGVAPFTITSERNKVVDFTKPFMEEGIGILLKKPSENKILKIFAPYHWSVWLMTAGFVLVAGTALFITNYFSPFSAYIRRLENCSKDEIKFIECLWLIYGYYMEQGGETQPRAISGRFVLGFWWFFTFIMIAGYTSNLAAQLTIRIEEKPIKNLHELAAQTAIKPIVKKGTNLHTLFRNAESGVYREIWDDMKDETLVQESYQGHDKVRTGQYAYMTDKSQLDYLVSTDCEMFTVADEVFNNAGLGFVMQEDSPYVEDFSHSIIKLQEAGLIDKWRQKWWPQNSDKCSTNGVTSNATTLDLESVAAIFIILSVSVVASLAVLGLEVMYHKSRTNINKNDSRTSYTQKQSGDQQETTSRRHSVSVLH